MCMEIEVTINDKIHRGNCVVKENARGQKSVVVNYEGMVSEALVLGRGEPMQTAKGLLLALVAKKDIVK